MKLTIDKRFIVGLLTICIYSHVFSQIVTVSFAGTKIRGVERTERDMVIKCGTVLLNDTTGHADSIMNNAAKQTFFFPVGERHAAITSAFGMRLHPVFGKYQLHNGIDIKANYEAVFAFTSGIVAETGYDTKAGIYCKINHGNSIETVYAHLSELFVKPGDWVNGGDIVGISGASGSVTGPHLHFGVKYKKTPFNPQLIFNLSKEK